VRHLRVPRINLFWSSLLFSHNKRELHIHIKLHVQQNYSLHNYSFGTSNSCTLPIKCVTRLRVPRIDFVFWGSSLHLHKTKESFTIHTTISEIYHTTIHHRITRHVECPLNFPPTFFCIFWVLSFFPCTLYTNTFPSFVPPLFTQILPDVCHVIIWHVNGALQGFFVG